MKRVMLDIETLSTDKHAAVLSIGVAVFDPAQGITYTNGWALRMDKIDGHINPATVKWWLQQEEVAREYSFKGDALPLVAGNELMHVLVDADEVWANDPDFDCVILQHWWERTLKSIPWLVSFRKYRSMRTLSMIAKAKGIDVSSAYISTTAHNPIEDAVGQARAVNIILTALGIP